MATRVLLTVDTELVWRHHEAALSWQDNFARSYEAAGVGVPYQLRLLADHGLKACFFVDPMPALVHGLEPVRRMVEPILEAGQEVQLHLHPFWARHGEAFRELNEYEGGEQQALIEQARDLLVAAGAPAPIAFRAGSYAANADTLRALAALGIRYDSSQNGSEHLSDLAIDPAQLAPAPIEGMVEIPVGQIEHQPGRLRHLQLCAVSFAEMRAALDHAVRQEHPLANIVTHSFELARRDGLAPNGLAVSRFRRLCRYLADHCEAMPTVHFADLDDLPLGGDARPYRSPRLLTIGRMAQQAWGNARYERVRRVG
ncbi:MAG: polysaccharide deacetylase [Alphaproteobacteria bacterium]|nr:polysaccharide deacetylase [Alphaproteobacteria bacterium]